MQSLRSLVVCILALALASVGGLSNQAAPDIGQYLREHYTKREYQIPMRDGVKLFTAVYTPKDTSRAYPIMLRRTPYSVRPYGEDQFPDVPIGPSMRFVRDGFIFALQDVRGRMMSEGEFVNMRPHRAEKRSPQDTDESTDTYDTIQWLIDNLANHNGRVGMWGISYPGFYTAAGIIDTHPALKAASPQAPIADWFIGDDFHHNGAFFLLDAFHFFSVFGQARPGPVQAFPPPFDYGMQDAYRFFLELGPLRNVNEKYFKYEIAFWNDLMRHGTYDEFWKARNLLPHLKNIQTAVMTVGGWFDAEDLYGPLQVYQSIERRNPGIHNILVMGPWVHGGWARGNGDRLGDIQFGSATSTFYQDMIEFPFFTHYLKDGANPNLPEAYIFITGANRWQSFTAWPPRQAIGKKLYLHRQGRLSFEPPAARTGVSFDEYLSDPAHPVPYTNRISINRGTEYMIEDQRFAARRPDVLVYQSDMLTDDVTLVGPIRANLFVSTTGTDADFVVKLIDVYPDNAANNDPNPCQVQMGGYQMLVRAEVMRAKFRESFERPRPLRPGQITQVSFNLQDVAHTFKKGHRIMVQVQSSWFPLVDRNPQTFVDIYNAREADFRKATHRVYHSAQFPSHLEVRLMP